jgi:predicted transposase YdaD
VIEGLNEENPVPVPEASLFARLQEKAKLSIFTEELLVSEAMNMSDRLYEMYVEKKHARAEGLAEGRAEGRAEGHADVLSVLKDMGLTPEQITEAKARLAAMDTPPAK